MGENRVQIEYLPSFEVEELGVILNLGVNRLPHFLLPLIGVRLLGEKPSRERAKIQINFIYLSTDEMQI